MISTNALSMFILHHHLNDLGNKNIRSNHYVMCASEPAMEKYNRVCEDFPDIAIITKSATLDEIQLTFGHSAVGNKSLGEYVVAFALAGNLSSPPVLSLKTEIAFTAYGYKIRLPIGEFPLRAAARDLAQSKKHREWNPRNAVLLPSFLTESAILHGESDAGKLLKIFARSITEWAKEEDTTIETDEANGGNSVVTIEAKEEKEKTGKTKQAAAKMASTETLTTIADDCDNVLAFLQAVAIKSP